MQYQSNTKSQVSPPLKQAEESHTTFVASTWKDVNKNTLRGTCDLFLRSGIIIRGLMLHERERNDGLKRWVQIPSREFKKEDGTRSFFPVIEFSTTEKWRQFNSAALAAIDELLGGAA
jgi:hypothetical protein